MCSGGRAGLVVLAAALAAPGVRAGGVRVESDRGFSIECPEGWVFFTSRVEADALASRDGRYRERVLRLDFEKLAVMLLDDSADGSFMANINVVVHEGRIPATEAALARMAQQMRQQGLAVDDTELAEIAGRTALCLWGDRVLRGPPGSAPNGASALELTLTQWQVAIPSAGRTLIATCSAAKEDFAACEPVFRETVNSLEFDDAIGELWYSVPGLVRYVVVGALAGAVGGALWSLAAASRRKQQGQQQDEPPHRNGEDGLTEEPPGD